jgi:DNA-binding CsgD family transcriptional regulator
MAKNFDNALRQRILDYIDKGWSNAQIATAERISAMTAANIRRHHGKCANPGAAIVSATPEERKEKALLSIAETMIRAASIVGVSVESVYADKTGNAIVEGNNNGEKVRFEVNVFA